MTDNELKQLVASLAISQKETDKQQKETDKQIKELSASQKETDKQQKETGRKLDKVAKMLGGIGTNQGDVAEDFFYNSFIKENHLGSLVFDDITKNMAKHRGKTQEEYDIFLTNGESIAIVEVKYKAHFEDIDKLNRKFNNFKKLFPIYKDYKLYGALASFYFNTKIKDELLKQGYFVVERHGELIKTENSDFLKVA
jgi:hypothetical protein